MGLKWNKGDDNHHFHLVNVNAEGGIKRVGSVFRIRLRHALFELLDAPRDVSQRP